MFFQADISLADQLWGLNEARHVEDPRGFCLETCSTLPCVAGTTVSLKLLLLIPFYLGLLPAAEWVPLLEAYFVMHVKGVVRSSASTSHSDIKGKISCLVPMIASLEKEEGKPGWSLMEQPGWEVTGMQERKKFKQNPTLSGPCLPCIDLYLQNIPWFHPEPMDHRSFLPLKSQNLGGKWGPGRKSYLLKITHR